MAPPWIAISYDLRASPAVPESARPRMRDVTMRWPVDEIGRYSVRPSTRPSTIAWPTLSDASTTARTPSANAGVATSASATAASTGSAPTGAGGTGREPSPGDLEGGVQALDQVGARVVLRVALALDVPQVHRGAADRERSPVPRAPEERDAEERRQREGAHGVEVGGGGEVDVTRRDRDHRLDVERQQHLRVGVVPVEAVAHQPRIR